MLGVVFVPTFEFMLGMVSFFGSFLPIDLVVINKNYARYGLFFW